MGYHKNLQMITQKDASFVPGRHVALSDMLGSLRTGEVRFSQVRIRKLRVGPPPEWNQMDQWVDYYSKAIESDPSDPDLNLRLGIGNYHARNLRQALRYLSKAESLEPKLTGLYLYLASTHYDLRHFAKAKHYAEWHVSPDEFRMQGMPPNAATANILAIIQATAPDPKLRNGSQAIQYAYSACQSTRFQNAVYVRSLAAAYAEAGQFDEAIKWTDEAIRLVPEEEQFYLHWLRKRFESKQPLRNVAKIPSPVWNTSAIDAKWKAPDAKIVGTIETALGSVAEHFAFCQTMPRAEFLPAVESLRQSGYRPVRYRPYHVDNGLQVAVVWARDGAEFQFDDGLTAEQVHKRHETMRSKGMMPIDLVGYADDGDKFSVIWAKQPDDFGESKLHLAIRDSEFIDEYEKVWTSFSATSRNFFIDESGTMKHSVIWMKPRLDTWRFWMGNKESYESEFTREKIHLEVAVGLEPAANPPMKERSIRFAGIMSLNPAFESEELHGIDVRTQLERAKELSKSGYRPVAISVARMNEDGKLTAASAWLRPVPNETDSTDTTANDNPVRE